MEKGKPGARFELDGVTLKELVGRMVKAIVDDPNAVEVTEVRGERTSVFELKVDRNDIGKVIGKRGRNALALRAILEAASTKLGKRSILEIIE